MRVYSIEMLAPAMQKRVVALMDELGEGWTVFETWRHPADQFQMKLKGVSKVGPMHSAHQYGLAADILPLNAAGKPHWPPVTDPLWKQLRDAVAKVADLAIPIQWDPGHVEFAYWADFRNAIDA